MDYETNLHGWLGDGVLDIERIRPGLISTTGRERMHVRTGLDRVWSAFRASHKERRRLDRTKKELTKMQADLDAGRFDKGLLNDVIGSLAKSANDDRLARDKGLLADDRIRLKDYQDHHSHWPH
jgi:hypothetical protein